MPFLQRNFLKYNKVCQDLCSVSHGKTCYYFLKSVKLKSNFSRRFKWQEILRRKTNKSYNTTAVKNDPGYKITFGNEFLPSDFLQWSFKIFENYSHPHASYSQRCVCLHKFSRINRIDLVSYMPCKLMEKVMDQLNFVQQLQITNQKGYSPFDTGRPSSFLSQQYLTSLCMHHTNVP